MATARQREQRQIKYADATDYLNKRERGFEPTSFKVPAGMHIFKFTKAGIYELDIIPYFTGTMNPIVTQEGILHFELTYFAHGNVGPDKSLLCCPRKTFKHKDCCMCFERSKEADQPEPNKGVLEALKAQQRQLFFVRDRNDRDKGVQVFETAHWKMFGEMLDTEINSNKDAYKNFFHLSGGLALRVKTKEDSYSGRTFHRATDITFIERKNIPESILDSLPCLEDLLIETTPERMKELYYNLGGDEETTETEEEETTTVVEETEEEAPPPKKAAPKTVAKASPPKKAALKPAPVEEEEEEPEAAAEEEMGSDCPVAIGQTINFTYKGKQRTGEVCKIDETKSLIYIDCEDRDLPYTIDFSDETIELVETEVAAEEEEEAIAETEEDQVEETEEEEEAPPPKKVTPKASSVPPKKVSPPKTAAKVAPKKPAQDEDWDETPTPDEEE